MNDHSDLKTPEKAAGDHSHLAARVAISAIPYAGGPLLEIFNALITPPIEHRRQQWMTAVGAAIEQLQKNDANIVESLKNSESFQSVLLHASWAAVRNHQQEKLRALHNAVINAAHGTKATDDQQLLFVRFVDELTPTHLVVMDFLVRHEKEVAHLESYQNVVEAFSAISKQNIDPIFFKLVCEDLKARGLIRISDSIHDLPGVYSESMLLLEESSKDPKIIVTDIGHSFISFVLTSPLEDAK